MIPLFFYVFAIICGLAYFALITFLKKVAKIQYVHGFILVIAVIVIFFGLLVYSRFNEVEGWFSLGFLISIVWLVAFAFVYGMAWLLATKKK